MSLPLTRRVLLGIREASYLSKPILKIGRWKVYDAGRVEELPIEDRRRNVNYQLEGKVEQKEKILVRLFVDDDGSLIKTKYYFLQKSTDGELAYYMTMSLLKRFSDKFPLHPNHILKKFGY